MSIIELETSRKWLQSFFATVKELSPEAKRQRIGIIRRIAENARSNSTAAKSIKYLFANVALDLPEESKTFRAYYLEGDIKPSARSIGRNIHIDKATVHRHNHRVLEAMLPVMFGIDGVFEPR